MHVKYRVKVDKKFKKFYLQFARLTENLFLIFKLWRIRYIKHLLYFYKRHCLNLYFWISNHDTWTILDLYTYWRIYVLVFYKLSWDIYKYMLINVDVCRLSIIFQSLPRLCLCFRIKIFIVQSLRWPSISQ